MTDAQALSAMVPLNLVSHLIIFAGSGYALIHARAMPRWHLTPLWWVGLASLFAAVSIVLGLLMGDAFALSYARIGSVVETSVNVALAALAGTMLWHVVRADIRGRRSRSTGSSVAGAGKREHPPAVRQSPQRRRVRAGARRPSA